MILPNELKEAIRLLPAKEKDKLIFRLLKKDISLIKQLDFLLVSSDSVEERRENTRNYISQLIERATCSFYSTGYLNMDVREMSGAITEHIKTTKDKYGEISLNLWMISEILEKNKDNILSENYARSEKFCTSVITKVFKILMLINKMHKDYLLDFEDELKKLGMLIANNPSIMKRAIYNGLDINWLIQINIPENIEEIHKDLRRRGYLR
ncbi:MAG: hypothetical protein ACK5L7_05675 [Paludibacteraceae bacterium]